MTVPLRAALYLRVSTARQAEHDVSIRIRSGKARRTVPHAALSWSRLTSSLADRRLTTAGPNSSA